MPSAYLQWRFHSGERVVARGPLVLFCFVLFVLSFYMRLIGGKQYGRTGKAPKKPLKKNNFRVGCEK